MSTVLRIATRKSALAMWQANHVKDLIESTVNDIEVELVPIVTQGDRILDRPLADIGGKGLFLKELELALLENRADLAVHSMKDVPAFATDGLALDVVLPRANPFDAFVSNSAKSLEALPVGGRVGTSSLRRQCQLLVERPDLEVADLRGNVDTRLRKLDEKQYDAIILACAGLERLGLSDRITQELAPPSWLPASTQGIICLQYREDDPAIYSRISHLNHQPTAVRATAERTVARLLEGSCQLPLAVYAELGDQLHIEAMVAMPDGSAMVRAGCSGSVDEPEMLGQAVALQLLEDGAGEIIEHLK